MQQQLLNNYKDIVPIQLMLPGGSTSSILPSAAQVPLTAPPSRKTLIDLRVNNASRHTFSRQIQPTIDVSSCWDISSKNVGAGSASIGPRKLPHRLLPVDSWSPSDTETRNFAKLPHTKYNLILAARGHAKLAQQNTNVSYNAASRQPADLAVDLQVQNPEGSVTYCDRVMKLLDKLDALSKRRGKSTPWILAM